MNSRQKQAWLALAAVTASVIGFFSLVPYCGWVRAPIIALAFTAITWVAPWIWRQEKPDERDKSIIRSAMLAGFRASYVAFVLGCMGAWSIAFGLGYEQTPVEIPVIILVLGYEVFLVGNYSAVLVLYGRHVEADNA
jgi:hypothetical protein